MPRYYRRRYRGYRSGKSRYSNETTFVAYKATDAITDGETFPKATIQGNSYVGFAIVGPTTVYGTRKAKNFDISLTTDSLTNPLLGALIYVPQGTLASNFNIVASHADAPESLYEPNQNVICQFMIPANGEANGPQITKIKSRLARNLDSGDSIVLLFGSVGANDSGFSIGATVNYAIKY